MKQILILLLCFISVFAFAQTDPTPDKFTGVAYFNGVPDVTPDELEGYTVIFNTNDNSWYYWNYLTDTWTKSSGTGVDAQTLTDSMAVVRDSLAALRTDISSGGTDDQTSAEVPYTNNGQTTVEGGLDSLFNRPVGIDTLSTLADTATANTGIGQLVYVNSVDQYWHVRSDGFFYQLETGGGIGGQSSFGISVSDEGGLLQALTVVSPTQRTIIVDTSIVLSSSITIPDSLFVLFTGEGYIDTQDDTLYMNASFFAPSGKQIFSDTSHIAGTTTVRDWYASWFGEKPNDGQYDNVAWQSAANTLRNIGGGNLHLGKDTLNFNTNTIIYSHTNVIGAGMGVTLLFAPYDSLEIVVPTVDTKAYGRFSTFQIGPFSEGQHDISFSGFSVFHYDDVYGSVHQITINNGNVGAFKFSTNAIVSEYPYLLAGVPRDSCYNILIENIEVNNTTQAILIGIRGQAPSDPYNSGAGLSHDIIIRDCAIDTIANTAIEVHQTYNVHVDNVTMRNCLGGPQFDRFTRNFSLTNSFLEFELRGAILGGGAQYGKISNNYFLFDTVPHYDRSIWEPLPNYAGEAAIYNRQESESYFLNKDNVINNNIFDMSLTDSLIGRKAYSFASWVERAGSESENFLFEGNHYINCGPLVASAGFQTDFSIRDVTFSGENNIAPPRYLNLARATAATNWVFKNCIFEAADTTFTIIGDDFKYYNNTFKGLAQNDSLFTNTKFAFNTVKDTIFPIYNKDFTYIEDDILIPIDGLVHRYKSNVGVIDTVGGSPDGLLDVWEDQVGALNLFPRYEPDITIGAGALISSTRFGHPSILFDNNTDNGMSALQPVLNDSFTVVTLAGNFTSNQAELLWTQGYGAPTGLTVEQTTGSEGLRVRAGSSFYSPPENTRNTTSSSLPYFIFSSVSFGSEGLRIVDNFLDTLHVGATVTLPAVNFNVGIRDNTNLEGELHVLEIFIYNRPLTLQEVTNVRYALRRTYGFLFDNEY